ncbi:MAG: hypothetical protein HY537_02185 [Deltaproteobacteria bacterium]|nr:hypothetical protein [Deltaproteobacteria bacterium]
MRRDKKKKSLVASPEKKPPSYEPVHIRLCHFCFFLNENESELAIEKCKRCGHHLTLDSLVERLRQDVDESELEREEKWLEDGDEETELGEYDEENETGHREENPGLTGLVVVW